VQVATEVDERLQPSDLVEELREDDALVDVAAQRDELVLGRVPDRC
jgi:chlorite dismutase